VRFVHDTFNDEYAEARLSQISLYEGLRAIVHIIEDVAEADPGLAVHTLDPATGESRLFDDISTPTFERADDLMIAAMIDALDFLEEVFGTTHMRTWRWGSVHRTYYYHTLFDQAGLTLFNLPSAPLPDGCTSYPAPGGYDTVNPGAYWGGNEERFDFYDGPVVRFVTRLEPGRIYMESVLPGGQRGVYRVPARIDEDDHFGDQTGLWLTGGYKPFYFYLEDVLEHAEERWVFGAEDSGQ